MVFVPFLFHAFLMFFDVKYSSDYLFSSTNFKKIFIKMYSIINSTVSMLVTFGVIHRVIRKKGPYYGCIINQFCNLFKNVLFLTLVFHCTWTILLTFFLSLPIFLEQKQTGRYVYVLYLRKRGKND